MQQSHYKSNYELKSLARVQTSQHMGILAGSLLLKLLISFMSVNLITALIPTRTTTGYILNYLMTVLVQIAVCVLSVGAAFIFLKTACNMPAAIGDLRFSARSCQDIENRHGHRHHQLHLHDSA